MNDHQSDAGWYTSASLRHKIEINNASIDAFS